MKYSIKKSPNSSLLFTYEDGIKAYRSTPVEKEFWGRIQELEDQINKAAEYAGDRFKGSTPYEWMWEQQTQYDDLLDENIRLEEKEKSLHFECQKYRVALNRIAHPESWSINEGFEKEIARRALVIGMKVEELPEGAAK